jgi:hypothetical protein
VTDSEEVAELDDGLLSMVRELRPASRWALEVALKAAITDGVAGTLVIQIPRQTRDIVDVAFVAGVCELTQRF